MNIRNVRNNIKYIFIHLVPLNLLGLTPVSDDDTDGNGLNLIPYGSHELIRCWSNNFTLCFKYTVCLRCGSVSAEAQTVSSLCFELTGAHSSRRLHRQKSSQWDEADLRWVSTQPCRLVSLEAQEQRSELVVKLMM